MGLMVYGNAWAFAWSGKVHRWARSLIISRLTRRQKAASNLSIEGRVKLDRAGVVPS